MFTRIFTALCLCAALFACERAETQASGDGKTVTALPEHYDRVREEQLEKEEDRLRQRGRHN